jgi:hypothetical protein
MFLMRTNKIKVLRIAKIAKLTRYLKFLRLYNYSEMEKSEVSLQILTS